MRDEGRRDAGNIDMKEVKDAETGGKQEKRETGTEGFRKRGRQEQRDSGKEGERNRGIQEKRETGTEGFRKGGI